MAFEKRSRGPQGQDAVLFAPDQLSGLQEATDDFSWLLTRGYGRNSAIELVGNRYSLNQRQRVAVLRSAAAEGEIAQRGNKELTGDQIRGKTIVIDGFNLLITLESALSGGFILRGRDGAVRDLASISGSYKRVRQTEEAVAQIASILADAGVGTVHWLLDAPISNSGKLAGFLRDCADQYGQNWEVSLVPDPDREIIARTDWVAVSSDSMVLDGSTAWYNLIGAILPRIADVKLLVL